jgi:chemotaxis protein MotB
VNRQVAELAEMLALERGQATELRGTLTRTATELRAAAAARDALAAQLREAREERERAGAERDAMRGERDRLAARVTDLDLASRGGAERLASLEQRLADALRRAEAAGGDAAQVARDLTAERAARSRRRRARRSWKRRRAWTAPPSRRGWPTSPPSTTRCAR